MYTNIYTYIIVCEKMSQLICFSQSNMTFENQMIRLANSLMVRIHAAMKFQGKSSLSCLHRFLPLAHSFVLCCHAAVRPLPESPVRDRCQVPRRERKCEECLHCTSSALWTLVSHRGFGIFGCGRDPGKDHGWFADECAGQEDHLRKPWGVAIPKGGPSCFQGLAAGGQELLQEGICLGDQHSGGVGLG